MKIKLLIIGLMLLSYTGMTQGSIISEYFKKFAEDENFTKVSVNSKMFSLFTELESDSEDEKDFLEAISKLKGLKIIASDSVGDPEKLFEQVCADINKNGYEELMTVEDAKEDMKFLISEKDGIIRELIMVVGGKRNFVLLSLYGEIDLKNISKITKSMKIHGLEKLSKIDDAD